MKVLNKMCGIAGIIDLKGYMVYPERIERMNRALHHRGPDSQDTWLNGPVGLGHTRLAIIDLTPTGAQPMLSHSSRYVITFNGEIYNFLDLRQELERQGIRFRGTSDTEVLLEAYAQWGPQLLSRLEGMFAFAIWDSLTQELFLARDRFGKKPLHYVHRANEFLFASEIKALLAAGDFDLEWDAYALSDYLSLGYILTPRTLYRQVRRLPAGSYALLKEGTLSIHSYWNLHSAFEVKVNLSEDERIEQLCAYLDQAVARRCLADVPLGAFLSGGLDSSSVVASMAQSQSEPPHTFSMAFELRTYDESGWANQVAQHLGTRHFNETIAIEENQIFKTLIEIFDEPFADTSAIPMWYLSRLTRQHVTVALSGDGADEILAGYPTYQANHYFSMYRLLPEWTRQLLGQAAYALPHLSHRKIGPDYKLRQFLIGGAQTSSWLAHVRWREFFSPEAKARIMLPD
jgi:asparagine synthase (glutamine-hydrolysing)